MDGEFMVAAFDKGRKRLVVFNDVLGRLPLLYHLAKDSLVVSQAILLWSGCRGGSETHLVRKSAFVASALIGNELG